MPNRLIHEKSPYLLQHAHNPVDWYAWGEEAFAKARAEDKPIFLSVGYSTCHWCHVMERESFENANVAEVLNQYFVPVKVDREERPDVDRIYMLFVQASTGSGGWPMSVWLTPDAKPFFGGTYFPPDSRYGRPGFRTVLESLGRAWHGDRARIEQSANQVVEQLRQQAEAGDAGPKVGREVLDSAYFAFRRSFDPQLGGFGPAPKFPRPSIHNFLVRYAVTQKNEEALAMVLATLGAMARGGMCDQLGGGFHRYSVDDHWLVPHFEKMLYDQAQLAISYLEAYQITREPALSVVAHDILHYVLAELTHPQGGFYSAEDADSIIDPVNPHEKGEGAFYIWTAEELRAALGERDAAIFAYRYGVFEKGNVDEDPHGEFTGRNVLYQAHTLEETAQHAGLSVDVTDTALGSALRTLLWLRPRRPHPHLDDKILTSWNAMMISAFAKGAQILDRPGTHYAEAARRALDFIRLRLWDESDQRLLRRYRDGDAAVDAFLDDYAHLITALIDMYETSFEAADLDWAKRLAARALELFEDREQGGFFSTPSGQSDVLLRLKDDYDGAEPSANSVMALALLRLARMTGIAEFAVAAERTFAAFRSRLSAMPAGLPQMLVAVEFSMAPPMEIVLAGPREDPAMRDLLHVVRGRFLPNAVVMFAEEAPIGMFVIKDRPTAFVCENYACKLPVTAPAELAKMLGA
ncbi:MAG TPA: thioredoxin domain-containing protein [Bryobacteraceae bacterium]|nr:thioredoxin domain-containing protein [Bryobacteraceae bacterium]